MTHLTLGPLFTEPLHRIAWCSYGEERGTRPDCPRFDYRITNPFGGTDLVNPGSKHYAVDVGNGATDYPLLAPATVPMRGARHFDNARGREFDLGGGFILSAWHLKADALTDAITAPGTGTKYGPWAKVARGAQVARTGNTGARLPTGAPMPHHTHIELTRSGTRINPEPYLFGTPIEGARDMDTSHFEDVQPGDAFYDDIQWMYEAGISSGVGDTGEYRPDDLLTRGQAAAFLRRLYRYMRAGN